MRLQSERSRKITRTTHRVASMGFVFMFNIFQKKLIEIQIEEYLIWKKAHGICIPEDTNRAFVKFCNKKDIRDIESDDVQKYHDYLKNVIQSDFPIYTAMKDVRCIFRYFKARKYEVVNPNLINEHGVLTKPTVGDIIGNMTKSKKVGRPPHIENIKKIKFLKDEGHLTFREIGAVMKKDVKTIYDQYHYQLPVEILAK